MLKPHDTQSSRVQPVFSQLYQQDAGGGTWLSALVALGSRAEETAGVWPEGPGTLVRPPEFEFAAPPPLDYLEHLVRNPRKLKWPKDAAGEPREYRKIVQQKRKALLAGSVPAEQEAIRSIRQVQQGEIAPDLKGWWVLEGPTSIDCALFAEGYTLFIEGKREEKTLKVHTNWYERRVQLYRNLDCLRALPGRTERFGLLAIVEEGTPIHTEAQATYRDLQFARSSWPHLDTEQSAELWSHYLGYTTWQKVAARFPGLLLPE